MSAFHVGDAVWVDRARCPSMPSLDDDWDFTQWSVEPAAWWPGVVRRVFSDGSYVIELHTVDGTAPREQLVGATILRHRTEGKA